MIAGLKNRWANYALMFIIAGAIVTVQIPKALQAGEYTAGLERDLLILVGCWISAVFGAGALSWITKPPSVGRPGHPLGLLNKYL